MKICIPFSLRFLRQFNEVFNRFRHNFAVQTDYDTPSRFITNGNIEKDLQVKQGEFKTMGRANSRLNCFVLFSLFVFFFLFNSELSNVCDEMSVSVCMFALYTKTTHRK